MACRYKAIKQKATVVAVILALGLVGCGVGSIDAYIFSDISECQKISEQKAEGAQVEVLTSPDSDKYLQDAMYSQFYACRYSSDFNFTLYAYEFVDESTAHDYFKRVTGKEYHDNIGYSSVAGMSSYRRIVINKTDVYIVYTQSKTYVAVLEYLNGIFSVELLPASKR